MSGLLGRCRGALVPGRCGAERESFWAHIDVDVLKLGSPMWTFPGHLRLQGDTGRILEQLLAELKAKATPRLHGGGRGAPRAHRRDARGARLAQAAKLAADHGQAGAINPHYFMAELGKVLDDEDIIFNEAVTNGPAVLMQIPRRLPNTAFNTNGAGLGWSGGMALGAKLAAPNRMMVQIAGDGSFYFCNPSLGVRGRAAIRPADFSPSCSTIPAGRRSRQSTLRVYPEGDASIANEFEAELAPKVEFGKVAEAFGAYAEKVSDPAEVPAAIARCAKRSARRPHRAAARESHADVIFVTLLMPARRASSSRALRNRVAFAGTSGV